jgi:hypothetical protein
VKSVAAVEAGEAEAGADATAGKKEIATKKHRGHERNIFVSSVLFCGYSFFRADVLRTI